jgi:integrase
MAFCASCLAGGGLSVRAIGRAYDREQAFGHQWRQTRRRAGLGTVRYHDLRHAFASMLISAGCSVKAVSKALGHSSASTTLNLYSHLWPATRTGSGTPLTWRSAGRLRTS